MRASGTAILLVGAAIVEVILLQRIVFHRAGGWGEPEEAFVFVLAWAALPFAWAATLIVINVRRPAALAAISGPLIVVALAGPLLAYVALAQYGHGTPTFMLIGLALQGVALLAATVRTFMPPNTTPHADARDVPAPAESPGARAGGRER